MRTFLVAVVAVNEEAVHNFLLSSPNGPGNAEAGVDCWWVAEDDRHDRSDEDSAIFVPRGSQADITAVVENWFEANAERWREEGYPYADSDVSGAWFKEES